MIDLKKLKELVNFEIEIYPEETEIEGNASAVDPETDEKTNQYIQDQLESGNQWAWCSVRVIAEIDGQEGDDWLGCCSYQSEQDFKQDVYYEDMKSAAFDQLVENLKQMNETLGKIKA